MARNNLYPEWFTCTFTERIWSLPALTCYMQVLPSKTTEILERHWRLVLSFCLYLIQIDLLIYINHKTLRILSTVSLQVSIVFSFAASADHDQPANPYTLIIICTVGCSVSNFSINDPINYKWNCPNCWMGKFILDIQQAKGYRSKHWPYLQRLSLVWHPS